MSNRKERAYNATRAHCFYCGCIVNAMNFHLNQPQPGVYVAACPDCARFKGSDDLETFRARLEKLSENSIQARLALKYRDAPAQQEDDAVSESKYHHNNKVTFYFERHPTHHYGE